MSCQPAEQLHKKAVTVEQLCRVPGVSRSGYYGSRQRAKLAPRACLLSTQPPQWQGPWQPSPERGAARSEPAHRAPARAPFDARVRATRADAQCAHHGQWPCAASLGQCAGAAYGRRIVKGGSSLTEARCIVRELYLLILADLKDSESSA